MKRSPHSIPESNLAISTLVSPILRFVALLIFPLVLSAERSPIPDSAGPDSYDLSPTLLGYKMALIKRAIILQTGRNHLAFRHGDWKLVSTEPTRWEGDEADIPLDALELYNLAKDPFETTDLATDHPDKTATIREGRTI